MAKRTQLQHMDEVDAYPQEYLSPVVEGSMEAIGDLVAPQVPASVQATSKVGQVTVQWGSVPDNDLERYKVYYGTNSAVSTASPFGTQKADVTSWDHPTEDYGTTFAYKVTAIDYSGNESGPSSEVYGSPSKSGSADLDQDSVGSYQVIDNAITETKISASAVTSPKISANAVDTNELAANAVTAGEIEASAVTTTKLAASAVQAGKIAASAITTTKLAANAVVANKMAVGTLSAITANMGTLTAGRASFASGDIVVGNNAVGASDGIYVASGGEIQIEDTDGSTVFNSSSRFQGARIIEVGTAGSDGSTKGDYRDCSDESCPGSTHIWNGVSKTVPSNKEWIVVAMAQSKLANYGIAYTDVEGHSSPGIEGWFYDDGGTKRHTLPAGSYSSLELYTNSAMVIFHGQASNDRWQYCSVVYMVLEVPA